MLQEELAARLRILFKPEADRGDLRTLARGKEKPEVLVRCREWLKGGLQDMAEKLAR